MKRILVLTLVFTILSSNIVITSISGEKTEIKKWKHVKGDFHLHSHADDYEQLIDKLYQVGMRVISFTDYHRLTQDERDNPDSHHTFNFSYQNEIKEYAQSKYSDMIVWNGLEASVQGRWHYTAIGLDSYVDYADYLVEGTTFTDSDYQALSQAIENSGGYLINAHPFENPTERIKNHYMDGYEIGNSGAGDTYRPPSGTYSEYEDAKDLDTLKLGTSDDRWDNLVEGETYTLIFYPADSSYSTPTIKNSFDEKTLCAYVDRDGQFYCSSDKASELLELYLDGYPEILNLEVTVEDSVDNNNNEVVIPIENDQNNIFRGIWTGFTFFVASLLKLFSRKQDKEI